MMQDLDFSSGADTDADVQKIADRITLAADDAAPFLLYDDMSDADSPSDAADNAAGAPYELLQPTATAPAGAAGQPPAAAEPRQTGPASQAHSSTWGARARGRTASLLHLPTQETSEDWGRVALSPDKTQPAPGTSVRTLFLFRKHSKTKRLEREQDPDGW